MKTDHLVLLTRWSPWWWSSCLLTIRDWQGCLWLVSSVHLSGKVDISSTGLKPPNNWAQLKLMGEIYHSYVSSFLSMETLEESLHTSSPTILWATFIGKQCFLIVFTVWRIYFNRKYLVDALQSVTILKALVVAVGLACITCVVYWLVSRKVSWFHLNYLGDRVTELWGDVFNMAVKYATMQLCSQGCSLGFVHLM